MKIIFCDIDGVLNSTRSSLALANTGEPNNMMPPLANSTDPEYASTLVYERKTFRLDPIAVDLLRRVVEDSGAKIVISSSWRIASAIEHFNKMFACYDWDTSDVIIDFTPNAGSIRGHEVHAWLQEGLKKYEISHFVIIDDHADFLPYQQTHLVQTNANVGFSHITYFQCLEKLGAVSSAT